LPTSVLIVEDDPLTQRTLEALLAPHVAQKELEVRYVDSADRARAAFEDRPASVVVCDLYLPKKDGLLLGEELRRRGAERLVLMGAGHIEPAVRERARQRLSAEVFSKPLELLDLVASLLGSTRSTAAPSELPEAGALAETPPAQRLLELWEERRSGELELTRGRVRKLITLRRGAPVGVASNLRTETLGHFLVQRGVLSDVQHQEALSVAQREGGRLGRVLVRLGFLTEGALLDELAAQMRHKLVTTLRWPDGHHLFTPGQPSGDRLELPFETPRLVFIGLRRTARLDEIVPRMRAEPARFGLTLRAERHRGTLVKVFGAEGLALLDRRPLVAELIAHRDAAQVLVLCDVLLRSGCAELEALGEGAQATPARDPLALVELGRARAPQVPAPRSGDEGLFIDPDTGPYPRPPAERLDPKAIDPPSDEGSGVFALPTGPVPMSDAEMRALDPSGEALRREVLAEYLGLHAKDHYQLLGLERSAAPQDIALALAAIGKRFRFERFAGVELGRDYARLEEIVARVRLAHDTLTIADRRAAYDQTLAPPKAERRDERLDAEVLSQEGLARLQRGDFQGARQKLSLAVQADGEQPDYHALLGWTTYLTALGPGRESASLDRIRAAAILAQPHLETALTIDPDHTDAHEFLGRIEAARGADADAADHLEMVLDQAPTRAEVLTALEASLAHRGEWHRLEQVYRRLIHRLSDDATERPLLVWWRLAELYRTRLQDLDAARVAYERVARLAPDDPRPRRALAELLRSTPSSWQDVAQALRESWSLEPEDPTPGRALFVAHRDGERWDAALIAASALACRGAADEEAAVFLRQHRPRFLVRAQEVVTPAIIDTLRHLDDDGALEALFAEVFAVSAPEISLANLGVSVADAISPQALPEAFARTLAYVSHVLDVTAPMVFTRRDFGAEMHVGAARPPVLLVGPQALATADLLVLAFRLARALSYLWRGRALAGALPTAELKDHLGAALTLAQPGMRFDDPAGRVATLRARLSGRATSLARTLRPHVDALMAGQRQRIHLGRFVTGMARTADRMGLLVCNDLPTAARIVGEECALGAEDDLIDFALGDAYLRARAHLGLGIAV
jgi:tetratricopeptide (TPR) repeat protein/DNA-binding response OmpR family regulator